MIHKAIRFFIVIVALPAFFSVAAHGARDQRIYPLPETETEDVVVQWLQAKGYHLRRSTIAIHGVVLDGQKGDRSWRITLWPHSPLATRVLAAYSVNGMPEPAGLQHLWSLLDDHIRNVMGAGTENSQGIPAHILSRSESVVCIYVAYPEKPLQVSGFIIDKKGLIICTAHGLKDLQQPLTVALSDGRELPGWVVKMDKRCDLTLVDVKTELNAAISLSDGRDLMGKDEQLFSVVCYANSYGSIFSGNVSGPPRKSDQQLLWQVNMQIRPGSSGSPVFNAQGNLVAVVKGRYRGAETVGFLIPFSSLMNFLSDYPK